jgi:hypothetical protein
MGPRRRGVGVVWFVRRGDALDVTVPQVGQRGSRLACPGVEYQVPDACEDDCARNDGSRDQEKTSAVPAAVSSGHTHGGLFGCGATLSRSRRRDGAGIISAVKARAGRELAKATTQPRASYAGGSDVSSNARRRLRMMSRTGL